MSPAAIVAEPPIPTRKARQSWAFLDALEPRVSTHAVFGLLRSRPTSSRRSSPGYSIAGGEAVSLKSGPFVVGGVQEHELRFVPDDALSLGLSRYQLEAGVRLGPLEPMARVGFTTLHLDVGHGFSFGMLTPRVGAGVWLSFASVRLGASAYSEYFWRWFGDESSFVHGLTFELELRKP